MNLMRPHTDREYENDLERLRGQIILMGAEVEGMIAKSIRALVERDSVLARQTIEHDRRVDRLEMEIDGLCVNILALRQPVASDLRFLTFVLKIVRDLERIGDLAVNTAERVIELNEEAPLRTYIDLPRMAEVASGMVRDALDALVGGNAAKAREVIARDNTLDELYDRVVRVLLTYMMENPQNIYRATRLQSIGKYLERIGDHATNLAEMVVFNVEGRDIRHMRMGDTEDPSRG